MDQILNSRSEEKKQFCIEEVVPQLSTSVSDIKSQSSNEEEVIPNTYSEFLKFKSISVTKSDEIVLRSDSNYSKVCLSLKFA